MFNYGFRKISLTSDHQNQISSFVNADGFLRKGNWKSSAGLKLKIWPATDKLISDPKISKIIASSLENLIREERIELIIALSISGIPLGTVISQYYQIPLLILRKTRELHGERSFFVGELANPFRRNVLLVDDSLLTGKTLRVSLNRLKKFGFTNVKNIFVFDYYFHEDYKGLIQNWAVVNKVSVWFIWEFNFK